MTVFSGLSPTTSGTERSRLGAAEVSLAGWAVSVLMFGLTSPQADAADLVSVEGAYIAPVDVEGDAVGSLRVHVVNASAELNVPIRLKKGAVLLLGGGYRMEALGYKVVPDDLDLPRQLHSARMWVMWRQDLPKRWTLATRLVGGLAGDFAAVDGRMLRMEGLVTAVHRFGPEVALGFGVSGTYAFGSFLPLPVLVLDWEPFEGLRLDLALPSHVRLVHTVASRFEWGAGVDLTGNSYAVRNLDVLATLGCESRASGCLDHIAYVDVFAGMLAGVRLVGDLWLSASAGYSVFRRFEMLDREGDLTVGGVETLPLSWQVRAGLAWRFPQSSRTVEEET